MIGRKAGTKESWAVAWKQQGSLALQAFTLAFGFSDSLEEAKGKVERAMIEGIPKLNVTADRFYSKYHDGLFVFFRIEDAVKLMPPGFDAKHIPELRAQPQRGWRMVYNGVGE